MMASLLVTRVALYRHRIGLLIAGSYLAFTALLFLTVNKDVLAGAIALAFSSLGLFVAVFYLISVFIHPDSDVASAGSTYPTHYFTLPVKTRDLVLGPVVGGILCLGVLSLLMGYVMRSRGFLHDPVLLSLFVVALLTSMQAIFWTPLGIPYSKLVLTILAVWGLITLCFADDLLGISVMAKYGLFGGVVGLSVTATWIGVAHARFGASRQSSKVDATDDIPVQRVTRTMPPFQDSASAQAWYEWRHQGKTLPALALFLYVVFLAPLYWNADLTPAYAMSSNQTLIPLVPAYLSIFFPLLFGLIPVYAWAVGCGARKSDVKKGERTVHLFFGTRPFSDEAFILTKLSVSLKSTIVTWGLALVVVLPLLFLQGGFLNAGEGVSTRVPLYEVVAQSLSLELTGRIISMVAILMFLTWRNLVIGLWAELSGNLFYRYAQPITAAVLTVAAFNLRNSNKLEEGLLVATIALSLALIAKLVLAGYTAERQLRAGLVTPSFLAKIGLSYLGGVAVVGCSVWLLVSPSLTDPRFPYRASLTLICTLFVLLCVPLLRLLLAVTTLSSTRHR